jgi:hypothetical protein
MENIYMHGQAQRSALETTISRLVPSPLADHLRFHLDKNRPFYFLLDFHNLLLRQNGSSENATGPPHSTLFMPCS